MEAADAEPQCKHDPSLNKLGSSCSMKLVLWQELTILPLTRVATHRKGLSPLQAEGRLRSLAQALLKSVPGMWVTMELVTRKQATRKKNIARLRQMPATPWR